VSFPLVNFTRHAFPPLFRVASEVLPSSSAMLLSSIKDGERPVASHG